MSPDWADWALGPAGRLLTSICSRVLGWAGVPSCPHLPPSILDNQYITFIAGCSAAVLQCCRLHGPTLVAMMSPLLTLPARCSSGHHYCRRMIKCQNNSFLFWKCGILEFEAAPPRLMADLQGSSVSSQWSTEHKLSSSLALAQCNVTAAVSQRPGRKTFSAEEKCGGDVGWSHLEVSSAVCCSSLSLDWSTSPTQHCADSTLQGIVALFKF